ncbi:hypothetical protein [Lampropedia aestuarii]|uniref:hypothetical protein n=1 Tax=Lampropedia aestuarii TaxID=2562762 RepID=UPI002469428A|nr:hypothetical protein [Lampropedia aestuarii]MDH5858966.1 hypothetical protein [Lampropedia aestuarii]
MKIKQLLFESSSSPVKKAEWSYQSAFLPPAVVVLAFAGLGCLFTALQKDYAQCSKISRHKAQVASGD